MAQTIITEDDLRDFAFDRPELNTLIDGVKFSSAQIERAMVSVVDRFNILPPPSSTYRVETFPSKALLTLGVWGWLLRGAAIGDAINNLSYSAAGVQINDRDKAQILTEIGSHFWQEFLDTAKDIKITQSINKVYGVTPSEYAYRFF